MSSLIQVSGTSFFKKAPGIVKCAGYICTWCGSNDTLEITVAKCLIIAVTFFLLYC